MLPLNANTIVAPKSPRRAPLAVTPDAETFNPDEIRVLYAGTVSHRDDLRIPRPCRPQAQPPETREGPDRRRGGDQPGGRLVPAPSPFPVTSPPRTLDCRVASGEEPLALGRGAVARYVHSTARRALSNSWSTRPSASPRSVPTSRSTARQSKPGGPGSSCRTIPIAGAMSWRRRWVTRRFGVACAQTAGL